MVVLKYDDRKPTSGVTDARATMSRGVSGRTNIYANSHSPSDDRTLYYSPVVEDASSLGATQLVTAPRSTGESRNSTRATKQGRGFVTHIFRSAISAFRPFKRPSPVKAAVTRVLNASPAQVLKPKARYANPVNWLHMPWESPNAMEHSDDENAKGPRASGSPAHPEDALVDILREKNGGARRPAAGNGSKKSTDKGDLKRTLNKKIQKSKARDERTDSKSTTRTRECVNCGVQGDSKIHWRRSYDELSRAYGQILCDRCGKAESRMLAKRKKRAAATTHAVGGLATHR